MISSDGA